MSAFEQLPKSVLVIDDDQVFCKQVSMYLSEAGVTSVDICHDGQEAWDRMRDSAYEAIILDWKLPTLSGLALFNRFRQIAKFRTTPILVVSGMVKRDDFRLLEEFPCTRLLEKPFSKVLFTTKLGELFGESLWFAENTELLDSVALALLSDTKKAMELLKTVIDQSPNPLPIAAMAARRLRLSGQLDASARLLKQILQIDPKSVTAMSEMGKVLHLQGRHREALDVLRAANSMSPNNLSRLCLMGEVELNLCEAERAQGYFRKALEIDEDNRKAQDGLAVAQHVAELIEAPENDHVPRTFASLLNVMGISMVRTGNFKAGIERYMTAMKFLHVRDASARVAFNLGIGYLRWGKAEEALKWFIKSEKLGAGSFDRSANYVAKLKNSAMPKPIKVDEAEEDVGPADKKIDYLPDQPATVLAVPPSVAEPAAIDGDAIAPEGIAASAGSAPVAQFEDEEPSMSDLTVSRPEKMSL